MSKMIRNERRWFPLFRIDNQPKMLSIAGFWRGNSVLGSKKADDTATQKGGTVVYEYSSRRDIKLREQNNVTLGIKKLSK